MKLTQEQIKLCNKSLDKKDIHAIGTGSFKKVYVKGNYVKNKLNEVFGIGNWSYTYELSAMKSQNAKLNITELVGYMAKVTLTIKQNGEELVLNDIGTGQLSKNDYGNEDKARKGAITDGLKRCAVNLGATFGLNIVEESEN